MKGLILKDLMCLRKQRKLFIFVVFCVFVVSIMYVLSANFGNIAAGCQEMIEENSMTEIDVRKISNLAMILFMLLPLSMVGDMSPLFTEDGKAGFDKVSESFPITIEKRILSRHLTILLFLCIGVLVDAVLAVILSVLTDTISFAEMMSITICAASVLLTYGALICFYTYFFGYGKESTVQVASILTIITVVILLRFDKVKLIVLSCFSDKYDGIEVDPLNVLSDWMGGRWPLLLAIGIVTEAVSYILSVIIVKRRRGVV